LDAHQRRPRRSRGRRQARQGDQPKLARRERVLARDSHWPRNGGPVMSSNLPFRRSDKGSGTLLTSRPPQVNLLPPEARAARSFGVVRRLLVYAMLGSVVLSVAIGLYAVT